MLVKEVAPVTVMVPSGEMFHLSFFARYTPLKVTVHSPWLESMPRLKVCLPCPVTL